MPKTHTPRRRFLRTALLPGTAGRAALFGPWKHNRVHAAASDKPIRIGLTHDASGQFANSGQAERRGTEMAIAEFNEAGGVLGRKIETVWMDTETNPHRKSTRLNSSH